MQTYAKKIKKTGSKPVSRVERQSDVPETIGSIDLGSSGRSLQLPEVLRERVQSQFGFSPESIRVKESSQVADMGAKAMAQGNIISFAPGVFSPYTESGQKIIGHELHHITEQARGLTSNIEGSNIHYNPISESTSDAAGRMFAESGMSSLSGPSNTGYSTPVTPVSAAAAPVQGYDWFGRKKRKQNKEKKRLDKVQSFFDNRITYSDTMQEKFIKANEEGGIKNRNTGFVGPEGTEGIDARLIHTMTGGMDENQLNEMFLAMGSGKNQRRGPYISKAISGMTKRMLNFNKKMLDENYILDNIEESVKLYEDSQFFDNFKKQENLKMPDKVTEILDNDMYGQIGDYISSVLGSHGIMMSKNDKLIGASPQLSEMKKLMAAETKGKIEAGLPEYKKIQDKYKPAPRSFGQKLMSGLSSFAGKLGFGRRNNAAPPQQVVPPQQNVIPPQVNSQPVNEVEEPPPMPVEEPEINKKIKSFIQNKWEDEQSNSKQFYKITKDNGNLQKDGHTRDPNAYDTNKFDNRQIGHLGSFIEPDQRDEFYADMGSLKSDRQKKHTDGIMKKMLDSVMDIDEEMLDEDYLINNYEKTINFIKDMTGHETLSKLRGYEPDPQVNDILYNSKFLKDLLSYIILVYGSKGIKHNAVQGDKPMSEQEKYALGSLVPIEKENAKESFKDFKIKKEKWKIIKSGLAEGL